jgi:hypothetical protein
MANQPLAFAELLAGSVLVISAITDRSIAETIRGVTEPAPGSSSIIGSSASASSSSTAATPGGSTGNVTGVSPTPGNKGPTAGGKLPPTPAQVGASIRHRPSMAQILAFNRKLAAKGEHMTRKMLSKIANGEISIHSLETQLGL